MIYRLQRKFVLICTASVLAVITVVLGIILALNVSTMNRDMDSLADRVSEGGGKFPDIFDEKFSPGKRPPMRDERFEFITPETPFATRHFTVLFDETGAVYEAFTESISITEDMAIEYANKAVDKGRERGWISNYRYKIFNTDKGYGVVLVDGSIRRSGMMQSMMISAVVLFACAALVLVLIFSFSKRAVKPIAESYEKQKQFITDAGHELKTPLTLILANLEIAEVELGKNEWLDDIRSEGDRMTELVNQLVALSRMDEERDVMDVREVDIGELVTDTLSEFEALANDRGKSIVSEVDKSASCHGDEALLHRLLGILLDNAIKYCDANGEIRVTLSQGRRVTLKVENSYAAVDDLELNRLFDRFYRADKARRFTGGYGIGLSMAKTIVEKHRGEITAYKKDDTHIGFKVVL